MSVLEGFNLEKICELLVGTNDTIIYGYPLSTVLVNGNEVFITRPKVIKNCTVAKLLYLTGQFNDDFATGYIFCNFACNFLILNNRQRMLL